MSDDSVYTPADFLGWALASGWSPGALPIGVVYTFQTSVTRALVERGRFVENAELTVSNARMLMTKGEEPPVLVACLNPGAVSMVTQLEHLRFLGETTRFAAIAGTAGALTADYQIGETVMVHSALRNDDVSHSYMTKSQSVEGDPDLMNAVARRLGEPKRARTWTVPVPYRSSRAALDDAVAGGASLVELEVASLFAAGRALGVRATAALIVSDVARVTDWEVDWSDTTGPTVEAVYAMIDAMREQVGQ